VRGMASLLSYPMLSVCCCMVSVSAAVRILCCLVLVSRVYGFADRAWLDCAGFNPNKQTHVLPILASSAKAELESALVRAFLPAQIPPSWARLGVNTHRMSLSVACVAFVMWHAHVAM
jgi:hypothetical protein